MILPQPGITRPLTTTIWVGVLNEETGERLPISAESTTVPIHTLRLNADQPTPDPDPLATGIGAQVGDWGTLETANLHHAENTVALTLHWTLSGTPPADYWQFIHLIDESEQLAAQLDRPPDPWLATGLWRPGDVFVHRYTLELPPDLPAGTYTVRTGLFDPTGGTRAPLVLNGDPVPEDSLIVGELTLP
ncbi:MAG: hypothetical protein GYB64_14090 [Chloroflexi bacterium]|nr:hypothetical protein [Chloroflexota bacterium]